MKDLCILMLELFFILILTYTIGLAFIDYFQNGRPDVGSEYVFLRHEAPFKQLSSSGCERFVIYMRRAEIENYQEREPGFRTIRHSFASMMLENNVSIYQIKEDLGHENIDTTMRYVKIDKSRLRQCALEVPASRH